MTRSNTENPELVQQHVEKNHMGDNELQKKPGKTAPAKPALNDRTPPHKGDPQQVQNVPGREQLRRSRKPDANETYRTGRQGNR